jgi:hypothetical protein
MKPPVERELRARVESAVNKAVAATGVEGFRKDRVVRRFLDQGASRATIYRGVDQHIASGIPSQKAARAVRAAARARGPDGRAQVVAELEARMPVGAGLDHVAGGRTVNVIERLQRVLENLDAVVLHAKAPDGSVRNAKLLVLASDKTRAALETCVIIFKEMRSVDRLDAMHRLIIEEIAKNDAPTAERILRRIDVVASRWS